MMNVLQRRHPYTALSPTICPLHKKEGELGNHLFLHCDFASKVWRFFQQALSIYFVMLESADGLFHQWGGGGVVKGARGKIFVHALMQGILWGLWKERNHKIFEDKRRNV